MRELSLFTGAGGGVLASILLGHTIVGYVEYEKYCQEIIKQRIADGFLDAAPIFGDIRKFNSEGYAGAYQGMVDLISGGFPCQPFSVAGKRAGADDPRNMWPVTIETIRLVRPRFAFLENVPGLLTSGYFGTILRDLVETGYDFRWMCLSASHFEAPHQRERIWIFAYPTSNGCYKSFQNDIYVGEKLSSKIKSGNRRRGKIGGSVWWSSEPGIPRVDDGMAYWVERIKATGNGQVPIVAATAFRTLSEGLI